LLNDDQRPASSVPLNDDYLLGSGTIQDAAAGGIGDAQLSHKNPVRARLGGT
jgi:hypothetical protein